MYIPIDKNNKTNNFTYMVFAFFINVWFIQIVSPYVNILTKIAYMCQNLKIRVFAFQSGSSK